MTELETLRARWHEAHKDGNPALHFVLGLLARNTLPPQKAIEPVPRRGRDLEERRREHEEAELVELRSLLSLVDAAESLLADGTIARAVIARAAGSPRSRKTAQ